MSESIRIQKILPAAGLVLFILGILVMFPRFVQAGACTGSDCCNPSPMGSCWTGPSGGSCCPQCSSGGPGPDGCTCWGGGWHGDCSGGGGGGDPDPEPDPCAGFTCADKPCGSSQCGGCPVVHGDENCCASERPGGSDEFYDDCGTECDGATWDGFAVGGAQTGTGCFENSNCGGTVSGGD